MNEQHAPHFPSPPDWSIMTGDLGKGAIWFAIVALLISVLAHSFGKDRPIARLVGRSAFIAGCAGFFAAFLALGVLFAESRFEFEYVWGHADSKNALGYRIAGIWSGQEGSFLLWAVCAAVFGLLALRATKTYERWYTAVYALFLAVIAGILAYETPFGLNMMDGKPVVPPEGVGLSPALQNYWVIIHPPVIFLGFGSLTILFALAAAALIRRDYTSWVPIVRPWAIVSTTVVGLGLCMGGFWAYETLGWGGFWMWDPVENVSFVPWCLAAALIHGVIVQTSRNKWVFGNLMLAALPFLTFVYGTFLTRSGFLADTSVHSFAEMNRSALQLLIGLLGTMVIGFTVLWGVRFFQERKALAAAEGDVPKGLHREGFYRAGAMLLAGLSVATLIGMSVPLFMGLSGQTPKVVEERLYHAVVPWLFVPLMLIMAVAPFVSWRSMRVSDFWNRFYTVLCLTVGLTGLLMVGFVMTPMRTVADLGGNIAFPGGIEVKGLAWILFLAGVCIFAIVGNVWRILELRRSSKLGWMAFVSHIGIAVLMAGLIISRGFERKEQTMVMDDHPARALGYGITYKGQTSTKYDRDNKVKLEVVDLKNPDRKLFTAEPGLYYVTSPNGEENPMVWPHIEHHAFYDTYITLHPPQKGEGEPFQIKPGETKDIAGMKITYLEMFREGDSGKAGTHFGARLEIEQDGRTKVVSPSMELVMEGAPHSHAALISEGVEVTMTGLDAATKSATLQLMGTTMFYPVEVYHKPLVGLVWLGTGIMTFGGLLAAVYRRVPRKARVEEAEEELAEEPTPPNEAEPKKRILVTR